jgi:phosphoglycolate phosphatase-like HAD superfamily hydrolase
VKKSARNSKNKTVIFDLDGTLADIAHRMPLIEGTKKRWKEFFLASTHDTPMTPVIEVCAALHRCGYTIRILSGRSESVRAQTIAWLERHGVPYHSLTMRGSRDYRPDHVLKWAWLERLRTDGEDILCIFDDRTSVVAMWRERGLMCFQVAESSE